jgi:hypothetical protein
MLTGLGRRDRALIMWNCNSLKSLHHVDWQRLRGSAAITTVNRCMKYQLWQYGVNPLAVPYGIPASLLGPGQ